MNTLIIISSLFLLFYGVIASSSDNLKLELVQVLFRHGARTPLQRSLNFFDKFNRTIYEPWGIGVLTNVGKRQPYELGLFLRSRYNDYLSTNYKAEDVFAYSTGEIRTKTTLQLVLAGLYPPSGNAIWNPSLLWTPIPYQYTPRNMDVLLRGYEIPEFMKLLRQVRGSSDYKRMVKKYSDKLSFLDEKTGAKASVNFTTLTYIFDILYANEYLNVSMPEWYTSEVRRTLIEVQEKEYDSYVLTEEMRKIGIGLLVRTLVENMNLNKTKYNPRKIYLYSGHESDLALFTRAHDIQQFRYPHFGNALIFEKWRNSKDEIFVRLLAWTGSENLLTLKLGTHDEFCPIEDYLKIARPVMLSDNEVDNLLNNFSAAQLNKIFFSDEGVKEL